MIIENLTDNNVNELKNKLSKMQEDNPEIKHQVVSEIALQKAIKNTQKNLESERIYNYLYKIIDKIDNLDRKIDLMFNKHVLIDGKMVKLNI